MHDSSQTLQENVNLAGPDRSARAPETRIDKSERRLRAFFGGLAVADSRRVLLVYEQRRLPVYYFPKGDVRMEVLKPTKHTAEGRGERKVTRWNVQVGDRVAENGAWSYTETEGERSRLQDYVAFFWNQMDAWYEEDEEVFVHARDPFHRIDVLNSSRHVRVVVEGEQVAETTRPRLLFETGLPVRYYIPKLDVRMDLLEPTDSVTSCPYKGNARYWTLELGDRTWKDLAWSYPTPIPECPKIEQLVCFYNEKVDLYVDGELQPRPRTRWS